MKQLKVKIEENKKIGRDFYRMRVESVYLAKNSKPGQFVEVKCSDGLDPLLRRPLGVHRISNNGIEILYEVVGKGTKLLSLKKKGGMLDLIGPLGNGFFVQRTAYSVQRTAVLVAGGIGAAPLVALAENLKKNKYNVVVMIGAKTKAHILCEDEFKALDCPVSVATEDGSKGENGLVTDLLRSTHNAVRGTIYACGPTAMLKAVAKIAEMKQMPCQVSMEERMACGVGVCLGCPVKVNRFAGLPISRLKQANRQTGKQANYIYKMVCKDGPVFNAEDIAW
jgi:dihydroorotate dehydrogenase electron transfer subunit